MTCPKDRSIEIAQAITNDISVALWVADGMASQATMMGATTLTAAELRSNARELGLQQVLDSMSRHWFVRDNPRDMDTSINTIRLVEQGGWQRLRDIELQPVPWWLQRMGNA